MADITKDEVLKIARLSKIWLKESEIEPMQKHLADVITYAQRVKEIMEDVEVPSTLNVNIFREDLSVKTESEPILKQAPEKEDNFFVVPSILDN